MADEQMGRERDLVLPPNTFAYVLDTTKGKVSIAVGPTKMSFSNTETPVSWDDTKRRFVEVNVQQGIQVFSMAGEGQYIVLSNPAGDGIKHPGKGITSDAVDLEVGRKVNIPGPATFSLWPGQAARTIDGHHLHHNQYLIVRVYDEQQARQNWRSAVVKPQVTKLATPSPSEEMSQAELATPSPSEEMSQAEEDAPTFTMGQLIIVKGTDVSFYIPPTGIEVVPEQGDKFVREAVTLERLEYCILLDENGEKRYMQGPAVVFPRPTEKFVESGDRSRKFRAIELNEQSGLYIKVIAEYSEGGKIYKVGEELFITGKERAIYFPRPEHSIIEYGGRQKHYAIAVPAGEGRYVLDRKNGTVDLIKGPRMFLPDPRTQVVVRRILDPETVKLLYPGNREAIHVNDQLRQLSEGLSVGEHLESREATRAALLASTADRRDRGEEFVGDSFRRGTTYTPPRTVILDTKYEGAVTVNIWPGYAVLVTNKTDERRVEVGPKTILLEYDETLMPLELSTGRPKDDHNLLRTVYLRVLNNQVGDLVTVETKDLVKVEVSISYRVNFEGVTPEEQQRWFGVENYVKVLADHARSRIRNAGKQYGIQEFYTNAIDIVREAILGKTPETSGEKRPGLAFSENGMRVYDVEVLEVDIDDCHVGDLLVKAQTDALSGAIEVCAAEQAAERTKRLEGLRRQDIEEKEKTAEMLAGVAKNVIMRQLEEQLARVDSEFKVTGERQKVADIALEATCKAEEQKIELARKNAEQEIEVLKAETEEFVKRANAVSGEMITALQMFGDKLFVEKIVEAVGPIAAATGVTTADIFKHIFKGTPFEGIMGALAERPLKSQGVSSAS